MGQAAPRAVEERLAHGRADAVGSAAILAQQNVMNSSCRQDPVLSTALSWKKQARSFEQMEFVVGYSETANLILGNEAERVDVQYVSPGLLDMLGIKPALGRGCSKRVTLTWTGSWP
jgi:hypothetical protein